MNSDERSEKEFQIMFLSRRYRFLTSSSQNVYITSYYDTQYLAYGVHDTDTTSSLAHERAAGKYTSENWANHMLRSISLCWLHFKLADGIRDRRSLSLVRSFASVDETTTYPRRQSRRSRWLSFVFLLLLFSLFLCFVHPTFRWYIFTSQKSTTCSLARMMCVVRNICSVLFHFHGSHRNESMYLNSHN